MSKQTPNLKLYKVDPETDGDMSFNIETMLNENWDKVDEGFEQLQDNLSQQESDYVRKPGYSVTSGTGNAYTVTTDPAPAAYVDGMGIVIRANRANTGAATLNWNGLGAVPIVDAKGNPVTAGKIPNGARLTLRYSASTSNFQLQGEGGEYGTATAADVLAGKTIGTESGLVTGMIPSKTAAMITPATTDQSITAGQYLSGVQTIASLGGNAVPADVLTGKTFSSNGAGRAVAGTMANRGAINQVIITQNGQYVVPQGYHSGSGIVKATFPNLIPENVKQGINIGGVLGVYESFLVNTTNFHVPSGSFSSVNGEVIPFTFITNTNFIALNESYKRIGNEDIGVVDLTISSHNTNWTTTIRLYMGDVEIYERSSYAPYIHIRIANLALIGDSLIITLILDDTRVDSEKNIIIETLIKDVSARTSNIIHGTFSHTYGTDGATLTRHSRTRKIMIKA